MNSQQWLKRVIRIRKKLIASKLSHKKPMLVVNDLNFLEQHLAVNRYNVLTFAAFFIRHSDKIYNILPGEGSGNHEQLVKEFNEFLDECRSICNQLKPSV